MKLPSGLLSCAREAPRSQGLRRHAPVPEFSLAYAESAAHFPNA